MTDSVASIDTDRLKGWLAHEGRHFIVFDAPDLMDALTDAEIQAFQSIVANYEAHRSGIGKPVVDDEYEQMLMRSERGSLGVK